MTSCQKQFRAGDAVRLHWINQYPLPNGWSEGTQVTVVNAQGPYPIVRDDTGQEGQVFIACVNSGWLYQINNRWLPENDPLVVAEREREAARYANQPNPFQRG